MHDNGIYPFYATSMKLRKLQQNFQGFLLHSQQDIISAIVSTAELSTEHRLGIYGNAYYARLIECMSENYPALHTLLGDNEFEKLCIRYIDQHPSAHFSVRYFGHQLASFLAQHEAYAEKSILAEMANWEWSLRFSFDAQNHTTLLPQDLEKIPLDQWPGLRFRLHPSCQFLQTQWNTVQIWQQVEEEGEPIAPQALSETEHWIIWRKQLRTLYQSLNHQARHFIERVQLNCHFQEICEHLAQHYGDQGAMIAATHLRQMIDDGIICEVVE